MRNKFFKIAVCGIVYGLLAGSVQAQDLLLHLPLDSGSGESGALVFTKDGAAPPQMVEGANGSGLLFNTISALAVPFDFDFKKYPQATVTAWIKQDAGAIGDRGVLTSATPGGLSFGLNGGRIHLVPGTGGISYSTPMPVGEWVFAAATVDMTGRSASVYMNDGAPVVKENILLRDNAAQSFPNLNDPNAPRSPYLVVGAYKFYPWLGTSTPISIDDVRLFGRVLSPEEIAALREGGPPVDIAQAESIGETEKNAPAEENGSEIIVVENPAKPYDVDTPTDGGIVVSDNSSSNSSGPVAAPSTKEVPGNSTEDVLPATTRPSTTTTNRTLARRPAVTAPTEPFALPKAAEGLRKSAEDVLPDASKPSVVIPQGPIATQSAAEKIAQAAEDALPDASKPSVGIPQGPITMQSAAEKIAQAAEDALPDASKPSVVIPEGPITMQSAAEKIAQAAEDALPGAPVPESREEDDGTITRQQALTPSESGGELYAMGGLSEAIFTSVAGFEGENKHTLDLGEKFLREIAWNDKADIPCAIGIGSEYNGLARLVNDQDALHFGCTNIQPFSLQGPGFDYSAGLDTSVIGSIEVCSGFTSKRLKGVRVSGNHVNANGSLTYVPVSDADSLARCGRWSGINMCPNFHVGTGLIVHTDDRSGDKELIVGLQLICKKVGVR